MNPSAAETLSISRIGTVRANDARRMGDIAAIVIDPVPESAVPGSGLNDLSATTLPMVI